MNGTTSNAIKLAPSEVGITKESFSDLKAKVVCLYPNSTTRAHDDTSLIASWLGTFDPVDSARTFILYRYVVEMFTSWMQEGRLTLSSLTVEDLTDWRDQLLGAPATRANRIAIIKSLIGYAHRTGYLCFNVSFAIKPPKIAPDPDARSLTEMQVASMILIARQTFTKETERNPQRPRYLKTAKRRLDLILWLYYSGCRISEVAGTRWENLHQRSDQDFNLSVLGKGQRRRMVPIPHRIVLEVADGPIEANTGRIFPVGVRRLQTIVSTLAKEAGLPPQVSAHWLRHASASHAVDRGAPLHTIQATLGHQSLATSGRYLHRGQDGSARYLSAF